MENQEALLARAHELKLELCRRDPNAFISYILKDEETGKRVQQSPYHSFWQNLVTEKKRLILWSHVESGKTQQITVGRIIWELGKDHSLRCAIVSNTGMQATKMLRSIGQYIADTKEVREVFPDLRPGSQWTHEALTIEREIPAKDASVQAVGVHGNILGARLDMLILDDIIDYENSRTEYQRGECLRWIESTLFGRLTRRAKVVFIGNAWHRTDAMHTLAERPGWHAVKCPVADNDGEPVWTERWDKARIEDKKEELGPLEFARQMMCVARADGQSRFLSTDINQCFIRGIGKTLRHNSVGLEGTVFTGVDLAISKKRGSGFTVFFTLLLHSDGAREVINITSGRWTAQEILDRLESHYHRFGGLIFVESNAAQKFIVQLAQDKNLPVKPFFTGKNKSDPRYGVESLSAEFARAQWIIPCDGAQRPCREVQEWVDELLYYDPDSHTGDRLMASWIAREGIRRGHGSHRFGLAGEGVSTMDTVVDDFNVHNLTKPDSGSAVQGQLIWSELREMLDFE